MPSLTKLQIRNAKKLITETVLTPEWGEGSYAIVKRLSAKERDQFEESNVKGTGKDRRLDLSNVRARLVSLCLVDDQGNRLFTDQEAEELGEYDSLVMDRIFDAAHLLNRLGAKGMGDAEKNSASAPS